MNELKCPRCGSSKLKKAGVFTYVDGNRIQRYRCKHCQKTFPFKYQRTPLSEIAGRKCPACGSSRTVKIRSLRKLKNGISQDCKCQDCGKRFTLNPKIQPAQPAETTCPACGSFRTVKKGGPRKGKYGSLQKCRCKDCNREFTLGNRKRLEFFLRGKLIISCWYPPVPQHVPDVACPNCNQEKALLKAEYQNEREQQTARLLVCLGCGQEFRGEGRAWPTSVSRKLGKEVPRNLWRFEDDKWDVRELYPHVEEHKLKQLFWNFSRCGSDWFKNLVKEYLLWRIREGTQTTTLDNLLCCFGFFGRFLAQQNVQSIVALDRNLLAIYWVQERGHLREAKLYHEMSQIHKFLNWGNEQKFFETSPTLITPLDYPKVFKDEPDPLEDSVLEAIRDNLHVLPEPLQLMFMLGFWLGARPGELCYLDKNCVSLEPEGQLWWLEFKREKTEDSHKLPITTDLVRLIQQQQNYINKLHGEDYPYLFCHYQEIGKTGYPEYPKLKALRIPPKVETDNNPMVKAINHLIENYQIRDSNGKLAHFKGSILRSSRATHLIRHGFSLDFVRIWLKHRQASTTKRHYTRYPPGELLDVATIMANLEGKFYPYDSNPESLRRNLEDLRAYPELHELDGLTMLNGEPLIGYCTFREFCPRFGHCYNCGFHVASADKLHDYKAQLERLQVKKQVAFEYGSSEILEHYQRLVNALENIIEVLESNHE